jgi:hypothetical protein
MNGTSLQPGVFAGVGMLQALVLSGNPIQALPFDKLFRLGLLTRFEMAGCGVTSLAPLQFVSQVRLRVANLSNNSLVSMPLDETLLPALQFLHLDHNRFTNADFVPRLSLRSAGLVVLDLSFNLIVELPRKMFLVTAAALRQLWLQNNRLTSLPAQLVAFCPALDQLYFQGNAMWQAPAPSALFALLDNLYGAGVDVQHDCVRTSTLTNGTCGPTCSSSALLNQTAEVALPAKGVGATGCARLVTQLPCASACHLGLGVEITSTALALRCTDCDAYRYRVCSDTSEACNGTQPLTGAVGWTYVWVGRAAWGTSALAWTPHTTMGPVVLLQGLAVDTARVGSQQPLNTSDPRAYSFLGDVEAINVATAPWFPGNLGSAGAGGVINPSLVAAIAVGCVVVVGVLVAATWWHRKALAAHQVKSALERRRVEPVPPPVEVPDRTVQWSDICLLGPLAGGAQVWGCACVFSCEVCMWCVCLLVVCL